MVFELIASMDEEEADKNGSKTEKQNRNDENRRQIIDFIADNVAILNEIINYGKFHILPPKQKSGLLSIVLVGCVGICGQSDAKAYLLQMHKYSFP